MASTRERVWRHKGNCLKAEGVVTDVDILRIKEPDFSL